jgi:RNA polymerase sigma-70 factor, ECF subfamily
MQTDPRQAQFLRLFLTCQPRIFAYIRSLVFSRADADDVLQETALVMWEKFDQFVPGTHFDRWAYRIAHLQVLSHRQKKARERLRFSDTLVERLAVQMTADSDQLEHTHATLATCIGKLPDKDRQLVLQRYKGDTTNRDVAHATGRSESGISRALNRIYTALFFCLRSAFVDKELEENA